MRNCITKFLVLIVLLLISSDGHSAAPKSTKQECKPLAFHSMVVASAFAGAVKIEMFDGEDVALRATETYMLMPPMNDEAVPVAKEVGLIELPNHALAILLINKQGMVCYSVLIFPRLAGAVYAYIVGLEV